MKRNILLAFMLVQLAAAQAWGYYTCTFYCDSSNCPPDDGIALDWKGTADCDPCLGEGIRSTMVTCLTAKKMGYYVDDYLGLLEFWYPDSCPPGTTPSGPGCTIVSAYAAIDSGGAGFTCPYGGYLSGGVCSPTPPTTCTSPLASYTWPLAQGEILSKAGLTELTARIDQLRLNAGLAAYAWSNTTTAFTAGSAAAIRNSLNQVYSACGQALPAWSANMQSATVTATTVTELVNIIRAAK